MERSGDWMSRVTKQKRLPRRTTIHLTQQLHNSLTRCFTCTVPSQTPQNDP